MKMKCKWCGKEFEKTHWNQQYCSKECHKQAKRSNYDSEYYRNYYHKNREAILKNQKKYYNANKDKILEYQRNYYRRNREHYRDYNHNYKRKPDVYKQRLNECCAKHGGIDNCPYPDCICE